MGHYDECRPGYCPGCGAGPGNIKNGVCEFCATEPNPVKKLTPSEVWPWPPKKTRHLDTAIDVLKGTAGSKRAKRKADVVLVAMVVSDTDFVVTSNGRIVDSGEGNIHYATKLANDRAETLRKMGKTVKVESHG